MSIHRMISLAAAALITLVIARFFTEETYQEPQAQSHMDAQGSEALSQTESDEHAHG